MPSLTVRLLGPPSIERGDVPVVVDTRKATALLAYLLVTGRAQHRESLVALLWPDADPTRARAAFRRTLSTLNRALDGPWLVAGRETVGVDRRDLWCDVVEFRRLLDESGAHAHDPSDVCPACEPLIRAAADVVQGDLLEGFVLRDGPEFEDWHLREAEAIRRRLAGALRKLVRLDAGIGRTEVAIERAARWLSLDPLQEDAHRELMRLHAARGDRSSALAQYRDCVAVLDRELGVKPLEETVELYRQIASGLVRAPVEPATVLADRPARAAPRRALVGRDAELAAIAAAHQAVAEGGRLVVVEGEAGIGKTRLVEDAMVRFGLLGVTTISARAYEDESTIAYGPIIEALRTVAPAPGSDVSRVLSGRPGSPAPEAQTPGARARLFESVADALCDACGDGGVLFFDDLQWADESSVDVIGYLCRRLDARRVLVILAFRSEEVGAAHRIRALVADVRRAGRADAIELRRLDAGEVAALAAEAGAPDGTARRLFEETEGLPFFVAEYLDAIAAGEEVDWSLPGGVRELIATRLGRVSERAGQIGAAAAVIGRTFGVEVVRDASGRSEDETAAALEELVGRGLIDDSGGEYRFRHEKVRAVAYERIGLARRRLLHRRVAEALRANGAEPALVANHYRLAGRDTEAAEAFGLAGEQAMRAFANAEAAAHFDAALALGHHDASGLLESVGDLRTLSGDYEGALTAFEGAAARGGAGSLARLEHKIGAVHVRAGRVHLAGAHFEQALSSDGAEAVRARVLVDWSLVSHRLGDVERAVRLAHEALEAAERSEDVAAAAQAFNVLGILASGRGDRADALRFLERSLELSADVSDPSARVAALNNLALVLGGGGDHERALAFAREALAMCAAQGDRHREAALHSNIGDLLRAAGRADEARPHQLRSAAIFAEIGGGAALDTPEIWKLTEW